MTPRSRDWNLLVQEGLSHGAWVQLVMHVYIRDETCAIFAHKVGDMAVNKEMSALLTNLAEVCMFNAGETCTLHSIPELCFKHSIMESLWTVPYPLEDL